MDRDELIRLLQKLPEGTEVFLRGGAGCSDDAWAPQMRVFEYEGMTRAFLQYQIGEQVNFPEGYRNVIEITNTILENNDGKIS